MGTPSLETEHRRRLSPEGLRDLLAVVNSSRGLDEILGYLAVQAKEVLGCDGVSLYLHDPDEPDWLKVSASFGVQDDLRNDVAPVGYPVIGLAVSRQRSVAVQDFSAALAAPRAEDVEHQIVDRGAYLEVVRPGPQSLAPAQRAKNELIAHAYQTIVSVPLIARQEVYGALVLYYRAAKAHGQDQVDLSEAFAQQAALAIENTRLRAQSEQRLGEIERRQRVAEALRDLLAIVNSNHDLDEILAEVLAQSSRLLGNQGSAVYLREVDNPDLLRVRAALGLQRDHLAMEVRVGSPTTGLAVQQRRTLVCQDLEQALDYSSDRVASATELEEAGAFARVTRLGARTDPDLEPDSPEPRVSRLVSHFRAVLSTPLVARGRVFGAITLFYPDPRQFTTEDVDLARAFAEQATLAIENARLHAEAEGRMFENERRRRVAEAMRDLLVSVNSTRSLDEVLDLVLAQASELLGADAGSVLLLDDSAGMGELSVRASRALVSDIVPARLPVGTAITGVAVERARPVAVADLIAAVPVQGQPEPLMEERQGFLLMRRVGSPNQAIMDALDLPRIREIARYYRALLAVPLTVRGRIQGAITLYYRRPRDFTSEDVGLAEAFADQTALAMENARLHAQTVRRTRELEALYRADEMLYASLRLEEVLQALVDVAADVLQADMTSVLVWDERHEKLIPGATRGFRPETVAQMSHAPGEGITTAVALSGEPIAVADATNDPRVAHRITDAEGIRSLLHVPIKVNGEVFGVFGVNYLQQRSLAGEEERVLLALAHRAALAIENARLYADSEGRRQELEALYRADETLHGSLRLDDVLRALVDVAMDVLHADKSVVHVIEEESGELVVRASSGYSEESTSVSLRLGEDLALPGELQGSLMVVTDAQNDDRMLGGRAAEIVKREGVQTAIGALITVTGQAFGMFSIAFCSPHMPTAEEQRLVHALAQRAGLAIHNARLFEQAQQVATAEERQRLARELHDAVTQTLFSASLIAEVVPRLFERDPAQGRQRLEELRRLTRGALAEMRTLLLELRPLAIIESPFAHLLRQLAEATASRANLGIDVRAVDSDEPLPPDVQLGLYRIAQEALNNTAKHAGAQHAAIHLRRRQGAVDLHLIDDGRGFAFDPADAPPGHFGLGIMSERARGIGAQLRIQSHAGTGTRVHVRWRGVGEVVKA